MVPKAIDPPEDGAVSPEQFADLVHHVRAELQESVDKAGLTRDPYRHVVGALSHTMSVFPPLLHRLDQVEIHSKGPDAAALARIETAAANGAAQRVNLLSQSHFRRSVMLTAVVMVGIAVAAGLGGYIASRNTQVALVHDTEAGLAAAFRDNPQSAALWLNLMRSNDPAQALAACKGTALAVQEGRHACSVPMWLDPPATPAPGATKR